MIEEYEILIDSDGVIADFDRKVKDITGKNCSEISKSEMWKAINHYDSTVDKFFLSLDKMHDADELLSYVQDNFKSVKILTASGFSPKDVKEQKLDWYKKHYPHLEVIIVDKSPNKAQYAHANAILIDDRQKSIDPFVNAGGIGILHKNANTTINTLVSILEDHLHEN